MFGYFTAVLPHFLAYFGAALLLAAAFLTLYIQLTPHRELELIRAGNFAASAPVTVRTEFDNRALAGSPVNGAMRVVLAASDPLLDSMALSKGRFAIEVAGAPPLYLPSWPEVTRVIEDCR